MASRILSWAFKAHFIDYAHPTSVASVWCGSTIETSFLEWFGLGM